MGVFLELTLYFFIYSVVGYLAEVIHCSISQKKLVNRGVLFGPLLPIYGICAIIVILITAPVHDNLFLVFAISTLICSALEYFTSWLIEKLFGIKWWDYDLPGRINLNGRICLRNSLVFGLCGCLVVRFFQPIVRSFTASLQPLQPYLSIVLIFLFIVDVIVSAYIIEKIKHDTKLQLVRGDQTNEIKRLSRQAIVQLIAPKTRFKKYWTRARRRFTKIKQLFSSTSS